MKSKWDIHLQHNPPFHQTDPGIYPAKAMKTDTMKSKWDIHLQHNPPFHQTDPGIYPA